MSPLDPALVLRTLVGANVKFVVVGEPQGEGRLRIVVSRHPTNLDALGRALGELAATVRTGEVSERPATPWPRRVGDPLGTLFVTTSAGDVDLMFGGPHQSLFAETLAASITREVAGVDVQWTESPPSLGSPARVTSRALSGRLFSLAGRLAHLVERRDGDQEADETADEGASSPASHQVPPSPGPAADAAASEIGGTTSGQPEPDENDVVPPETEQ